MRGIRINDKGLFAVVAVFFAIISYLLILFIFDLLRPLPPPPIPALLF